MGVKFPMVASAFLPDAASRGGLELVPFPYLERQRNTNIYTNSLSQNLHSLLLFCFPTLFCLSTSQRLA